MTNVDPDRYHGRWEALDDLEVARNGLKSISELVWLSDRDAPDTAGLIRRTYETYPELDLMVSQQGLARRIAAVANADRLPLDDRLFVALLARTVDPRLRMLTERAVALAAQARAWDIVVELVGSASPQDGSADAVTEHDAPASGSLASIAQLISHLPRQPSEVMWRIGDHLGDEIDGSVPVNPGARVTPDPWQTADLFVQGRNLIESGGLQPPRRPPAVADAAASVASARRCINAVFAREAVSSLPPGSRPQPNEQAGGRVRWADFFCDQEIGSIPARLLRLQNARRDEAGDILIDRSAPDRLVYGPYCRLAAGSYLAKLTGYISGIGTLRFVVVSGNQIFAMSSAVADGPTSTDARPDVRELAMCSFILSDAVYDIEFVVENVQLSGEMLISSVELQRNLSPTKSF